MKLRLLTNAFAFLALGACATSAPAVITDGPANGEPSAPIGTPAPTPDEEDPANQPPHSLGTIVLGEAHGSGAGATRSVPIVTATFIPDALLAKACTKKVDGCEVQQVPKCTKVTTSSTGCNTGETCAFDDACNATCKRVPVCETACQEDETCKLVQPNGTSPAGTCVKRESFDAGPLAFSGTTTPITLYPPYAYEGSGQGAPFLAGSELRVQASGATEAGFEKFDEKFTATTFLQTSPSLSKISRDKVFGSGPLPIAWVPGKDRILISISGPGGTATCKVDDAAGTFEVPRTVVNAALGDGTTAPTGTTQALSISVARQRKEIKKDKKAKGELSIAEVKPEGWLELVTTSSESASFQGCAATQQLCKDVCTSTQTDAQNCGECGRVCPSGACQAGSCVGSSTTCDSCTSSYCSSYRSTCTADPYCNAILTCASSCTTSTCIATCRSNYISGASKWDSLQSCRSTYCKSSCGF